MRRLLTVTALLAAASAARADFGTNLEEGEKESKAKNKLMLVYIWSPTCHVCKGLNEKVWPNIAVQTELENWSAVKLEANEAASCHYRWKIDDMPQLRVISPEGKEFRMVPRGEIPEANPDKMLDFLAGIRASWDEELASRKFMWEATYADAKSKSKERQRPLLIFVHDTATPPRELNLKFPQFTDPACAAPAKKFVCVAAGKDVAEVWDKFKPQVVPGFIFVDLEGAELGRCGFLDTAELATAMNGAVDKFAAGQNIDPAKKLERDIASYEAAMKGSVEQDKCDAAQRLIDSKDPKVVKPLTLALKDPSVKLKDMVIAPILQLDAKNGLPVVLAWIKTEANNKLVIKAWDAIGETGDLRAVGPAEDSILDVASQDVSRARIRALGNMKHKDVIDFLIDLPFKFKGKGGRGPGGGGGLREECKRSLNKLTGEDYGEDWNEWKKWWRDNQRTFKFQ
ncbi:MAG: thioredoxin domain-containing protein [Planctomycetota bacterium]